MQATGGTHLLDLGECRKDVVHGAALPGQHGVAVDVLAEDGGDEEAEDAVGQRPEPDGDGVDEARQDANDLEILERAVHRSRHAPRHGAAAARGGGSGLGGHPCGCTRGQCEDAATEDAVRRSVDANEDNVEGSIVRRGSRKRWGDSPMCASRLGQRNAKGANLCMGAEAR